MVYYPAEEKVWSVLSELRCPELFEPDKVDHPDAKATEVYSMLSELEGLFATNELERLIKEEQKKEEQKKEETQTKRPRPKRHRDTEKQDSQKKRKTEHQCAECHLSKMFKTRMQDDGNVAEATLKSAYVTAGLGEVLGTFLPCEAQKFRQVLALWCVFHRFWDKGKRSKTRVNTFQRLFIDKFGVTDLRFIEDQLKDIVKVVNLKVAKGTSQALFNTCMDAFLDSPLFQDLCVALFRRVYQEINNGQVEDEAILGQLVQDKLPKLKNFYNHHYHDEGLLQRKILFEVSKTNKMSVCDFTKTEISKF